MRVLVACEFSGVVRDAFAAWGHDAWSCDLEPTEASAKNHIEGDVLKVLDQGWDLMIAHPPCDYLCSSGLHWNGRTPGRDKLTAEAMEFVMALINAPIGRIALENPVGRISTAYRKADQIIQPWMFGENASKGTCLWLKNLPPLLWTEIVPPKFWSVVVHASDLEDCECCEEKWCHIHERHYGDCDCIGPTMDEATYRSINGVLFATLKKPAPKPVWANQTPSGQNKLGPSPRRKKDRSTTYRGIANAMAAQWGAL